MVNKHVDSFLPESIEYHSPFKFFDFFSINLFRLDITSFFKEAIERGVIPDDALSDEKIKKTCEFISEADEKFESELLTNKELSKKIENGSIISSYISDAQIDDGTGKPKPVIDLVQQGGGMYGIALVGYTYIMEKVGIRFYSYGGTSAGGINASFLAAMPKSIYTQDSFFLGENKKSNKSEVLVHLITNTDFKTFMDRKGIVGIMQQLLFRGRKSKWLKRLFLVLALAFLVGLFAAFHNVFSLTNGVEGTWLRIFDFIIGTFSFLALLLFLFILIIKLMWNDFGVNTGDVFYKWSNDLFALFNIYNTNDLYQRLYSNKIIGDNANSKPRLVMISSNLTHNRIVKFPERAPDYWNNEQKIKPAAYLRATMSLPFIFRTFIPDENHFHNQNSSDIVTKKARFVDGGMLSNFPIREFHRSDGQKPRFPTFGVLLSDMGLDKEGKKEEIIQEIDATVLPEQKFLDYIKSYFTTFRNFYDYEFIFGSEEIKKRVVTVDTEEFNWLNFWMKSNRKKKLFLKGVEAAIDQLTQFEWEIYVPTRMQADKMIIKQNEKSS